MTPQDALQTSCAGKGRFPTQQQAAERAKRMRRRKGSDRRRREVAEASRNT